MDMNTLKTKADNAKMTLNAFCRILTILPLNLSAKSKHQIFGLSVRHVRGRGANLRNRRNTQPQTTEEFRDFLDSDDFDLDVAVGRSDQKQWEEFITNLDFRDPNVLQDLERLDKLERNKLKNKIIKRKYFKREHEDSVLTWQAKEQMRYLNQESPEEWTVDKLVESFPVSREGVISVLNSTYIPADHKEIRKHDNKALQNIKNIKKKLSEDFSMDTNEREALENKIQKVGNAAGIKSLPLTQLVTRQTIARQSKLLRPDNKIGPFKSMLMYYDRVVEGDKTIQNHKYELLPDSETDQQTEKIDMKFIEQTHNSESPSMSSNEIGRHKRNKGTDYDVKNSSYGHKYVQKDKLSVRTSRDSSQVYQSDIKRLQEENLKNTEHLPGKIQKWNTSAEVSTKDTFGKIITEEKSYEDLFVDDQNYSELNNNFIDEKRHKKQTTSFYQEGNVVYDDQGEILFKIP